MGDISSKENEISRIQNCDMSSIWPAFRKLREFRVRGTEGLRLGNINHSSLSTLAIETRGLPALVAREALQANAPIDYLELWFGDEQYGLTTKVADLHDLLEGKLLPNLKTLAFYHCNSVEIIERLAKTRFKEFHFSWPPFENPVPLLRISFPARARRNDVKGVGTAATRAEIIKGLKWQLLGADGRQVIPTPAGLLLSDYLRALVDPRARAELKKQLDPLFTGGDFWAAVEDIASQTDLAPHSPRTVLPPS